ncbi:hypothetical protein RU639_012692 [Aspergillus parasiticus]
MPPKASRHSHQSPPSCRRNKVEYNLRGCPIALPTSAVIKPISIGNGSFHEDRYRLAYFSSTSDAARVASTSTKATRLQSKATTPIANGPLSSLQARENVAYPSDPEEGYRAPPTLITGNSSFTTQQKPIAPRGRKSRWATLSIEAEASLSLIYRELESATSLEKQLEQLREENSRYLQMIKIRDQDLIALRREMGNQRISDGELESLKARADQYDTVLQELERTSS